MVRLLPKTRILNPKIKNWLIWKVLQPKSCRQALTPHQNRAMAKKKYKKTEWQKIVCYSRGDIPPAWYLLLSLLPDKPNWLAKLSNDLLLEVCSSKYLSLRTDLAKPNSSEGFIDLSWDLALWDLSNPFPCWFLSGLADLLNLKLTKIMSIPFFFD